MQITREEFHAKYGKGRPAMPGWSEQYADPHVTPEHDVRVMTALVDHFKLKRCLEIGCNNGATSIAMLTGSSITEYVGVDLPKIWFYEQAAGKFALGDPRFKLMQFENGSDGIVPEEVGLFDFILIDGNHTYDCIKRDTELARKILAPGGIIAWHDYSHPKESLRGVTKYVDEVAEEYKNTAPVVCVEGTVVAYQVMPKIPENRKVHLFGTPGAGKTTLLGREFHNVWDDNKGSFQCFLGNILKTGIQVNLKKLDNEAIYLWLDTPIEIAIKRNKQRAKIWKGIPVKGNAVNIEGAQIAYHELSKDVYARMRLEGMRAYRIDGSLPLEQQRTYIREVLRVPMFIDKDTYLSQAKRIGGDHWKSASARWEYHAKVKELLLDLNLQTAKDVLEVGSCGVEIVQNSHTVDYTGDKRWGGFNPDVLHDLRVTPWPFFTKQFKVAIALRVFHHLAPKQEESFKEILRISEYVCVLCPEQGKDGIARQLFFKWANCPPEKCIETGFGPILLYKGV